MKKIRCLMLAFSIGMTFAGVKEYGDEAV